MQKENSISLELSLTPDAILTQVRIEAPRQPVIIRGIVERLTAYPAARPVWVYGTLRGVERSLEFRCPFDSAPSREGEHVLLAGVMSIKPSKVHKGFDLLLEGEIHGRWEPIVEDSSRGISVIRREKARRPLASLLRACQLSDICVLASPRGVGDSIAALERSGVNPSWAQIECNFSDKQKIIQATQKCVLEHYPKGIVFIRGGSDEQTLQIWDDPELVKFLVDLQVPFYVAIGHSDKLMLVDKFCDESFTTPTHFGESVVSVITAMGRERLMVSENQQLKNAVMSAKRREAGLFVAFGVVCAILAYFFF